MLHLVGERVACARSNHFRFCVVVCATSTMSCLAQIKRPRNERYTFTVCNCNNKYAHRFAFACIDCIRFNPVLCCLLYRLIDILLNNNTPCTPIDRQTSNLILEFNQNVFCCNAMIQFFSLSDFLIQTITQLIYNGIVYVQR